MSGFQLPNITLGKDAKRKSVFDLSHKVNGTLQFGEVVPCYCQSMIAGSKLKVSNNLFARLATMPLPTMGNITIRNYFQFVPIEDVFPIWNNQVSGTSIKGIINTNVPCFQVSDMMWYLLLTNFNDPALNIGHACTWTAYKTTTNTGNYVWEPLTSGQVDTLYTLLQSSASCPDFMKLSDGSFLHQIGFNKSYCSTHSTYSHHNTSSALADNVSPAAADQQLDVTIDGTKYKICWRYSWTVKRYLKSLIGCGYQLALDSKEIFSILPMLANYKAWYDIFGNLQQKPWTDTNCYKIINAFLTSPTATYTASFFTSAIKSSSTPMFAWLKDEYSSMFYQADIDFLTAHQVTPAIGTGMSQPTVNLPNSFGIQERFAISDNTQPATSYVSSNFPYSSNAIQLLIRLTRDINKNTILGKRINTYLKTHGLGSTDIEMQSNRVGSAIQNIDISAVLATAESTNVDLGQYAGVGISKGTNGATFETNKQGYFFVLQCVVPSTGWAQGVDLANVYQGTTADGSRYSWFDGQFDALGYTITPKSVMSLYRDYISNFEVSQGTKLSGNYGFIPRYSALKVKGDKFQGDFVPRSTRLNLLPYTMSRYIDREPCNFDAVGTGGSYVQLDGFDPAASQGATDLPVADPKLRMIGEIGLDWLGNFNRIFSTPTVDFDAPNLDTFILHNDFKVSYIAPMLSISDSYDTDENAAQTLHVMKS